MTVRVIGLEETQRKFRQARKIMDRALLKKAVQAGADPIEKEAKRLVPTRTGALRDSITTRITKATANMAEASVAPDREKAWYGHFVEFGTVRRAAHPFLLPAFDNEQTAIDTAVRTVLTLALNRIP